MHRFRRGNASRTTGVYTFFAEDVVVYREQVKIRVEWPDGRVREFRSGTCEFAPHDPDRKYDPEETQPWQGPDPDEGVTWASL